MARNRSDGGGRAGGLPKEPERDAPLRSAGPRPQGLSRRGGECPIRMLWWSLAPVSRSASVSAAPRVTSQFQPSVPDARPSVYRPVVDVLSLREAAESGGVWRLLDEEGGNPLVVCPACWLHVVSALLRTRQSVIAHVLGARPDWARCGVCDPDDGP